ncbi:alpha/beta hydrolase [Candidatus Thorarchaeota archaeon]|nr:MAG: alpha/beta hydrolase [Candidatus Thorarchaeota archaeon]
MTRMLEMDPKRQFFAICLILLTSSSVFASMVQSDFGTIDIEVITIVDESGISVVGKLYRPLSATENDPAPGVLLLHGMNNDKDTEGPVALELARRGIVSLALDQLSHGDSDSGENLLNVFLSGIATLGANASYQFLKGLAFVDASYTGLVGHSMGASVARVLAETNPDHRAVVIQAGGPDNLTELSYMNNYLNVWPRYEELFYTGDRASFVEMGLEQIAENEGLADASQAQVDFTYGTFSDGSASRYALCGCTHPGATWNAKGIAETCAWMLQALVGYSETEAWSSSSISTQTYMMKEVGTLFALIMAVVSIIPLAMIAMEIPYFQIIRKPLPDYVANTGVSWWRVAVLNATVGAVTFLFLPYIGMLGGIFLGIFLPVFKLVTGNGSLLWLLVNALIAMMVFKRWFPKATQEENLNAEDIGMISKNPESTDKEIIKRTLILTAVLFGYLYVATTLVQSYMLVEFRYMWPQFKMFTPQRFLMFLVYLIPVLPFFIYNGGFILFGLLRQKEYDSPLRTNLIWWIKGILAMEGGLLVAILIQYVPMILLGTPPLLYLGGLFGLYGIFLMSILPFFAGIFLLMTVFYHETGRVYLGAFVATVLVAWMMAVSSLMM